MGFDEGSGGDFFLVLLLLEYGDRWEHAVGASFLFPPWETVRAGAGYGVSIVVNHVPNFLYVLIWLLASETAINGKSSFGACQ